MSKKIAVIGAGITGITTAYYLAKEGYQVTVFDQERHVAMRTSYANGGQLSVSNSEVWTTWSNVKKGIKWMFKKDAPLLVRPRLDWAQWKWITKFLYHTVKGDYQKNTARTIEMGLESRKLLDDIAQEEGIDFDHTKCGILHIYKDKTYYRNAVQTAFHVYSPNYLSRFPFRGENAAQIYHESIHGLEKDTALDYMGGIVGVILTPSDSTGDIHKFCYELAEVLANKYGVVFQHEFKVDHYQDVSHFDKVVVCAGVGSKKFAKTVGDSLDIYPVKGYSITINNVDPEYLPKVSLLDDQAKIVTATLGTKFRVAGTAELAGENYDILRDRIEPLLKWVHTNFPKINTHDYTSWACLRPMTPNMMPIVKQSDKNKKVFYNTGHGHLGWTLGAATAKMITKQLKDSDEQN